MSSKADDFDVRYRDVGTAGHGRPAADGGYRGNAADVDYDLGYDAEGWDTQGSAARKRTILDSRDRSHTSGPVPRSTRVTATRSRRTLRGRGRSRARAAGTAAAPTSWDGNLRLPGLCGPPCPRPRNRGGGPGGPGGPGGCEARAVSADRDAAGWWTGPGQGQGQLVAALDVAEGRWACCWRVIGAFHRARRHRGGRDL